MSSDIKAIKISKLIDFHREVEQRSSDIFNQFKPAAAHSATKAELKTKNVELVDHDMRLSEDQEMSNRSSQQFKAS